MSQSPRAQLLRDDSAPQPNMARVMSQLEAETHLCGLELARLQAQFRITCAKHGSTTHLSKLHFAKAVGCKNAFFANRLFGLYADQRGDAAGLLGFVGYARLVSSLSILAPIQETAQVIFNVLDVHNQGRITVYDLAELLAAVTEQSAHPIPHRTAFDCAQRTFASAGLPVASAIDAAKFTDLFFSRSDRFMSCFLDTFRLTGANNILQQSVASLTASQPSGRAAADTHFDDSACDMYSDVSSEYGSVSSGRVVMKALALASPNAARRSPNNMDSNFSLSPAASPTSPPRKLKKSKSLVSVVTSPGLAIRAIRAMTRRKSTLKRFRTSPPPLPVPTSPCATASRHSNKMLTSPVAARGSRSDRCSSPVHRESFNSARVVWGSA